MKIITWNCNGAFRKKYHALDEYDADILVIQECENPETSQKQYKDWASEYLWIGNNKNKGLGIFSRRNAKLKKLEWIDNGLQIFLPCRVNESFNLIAVWTKQANSPNFRYIGQLWKYLELHKEKMAVDKTVLCGDFNSNTQWDEWDRWWNHSDVVRDLNAINMHSIYHVATGEAQGKESQPTLFMYRNLEKPYHIDFAFASEDLLIKESNSIKIEDPNVWLEHSDHVPVIFEIKI